MIEIEADGNRWRVSVSQNGRLTRHEVTVSDADRARLAGDVPARDLIRTSFEFLLEREPNTAILPRFELTEIERYFPDYERAMHARFGRR